MDNLSKTIQKESFSVVDSPRSADLTLQTLKGIRTDEAAKLFYDTVAKKATKHEIIESSVLPRKRKRSNYKTIHQYFQIDGYKWDTEAYYSDTLEDHYCSTQFDSLDIITSAIKTRFEEPSFEAILKLESFLLQSVNNWTIDDELITFLGKVYSDDLDTDALIVEGVVLKTMMENCEIKCFRDI